MLRKLEVFLDDAAGLREVGIAHFTLRHNAISTTFSYTASYLKAPSSYAIDPGLPLVQGSHHCEGLPGAFRDSSPDRWGRNLIMREHRLAAGSSGRALSSLDEVDYLAGVLDSTREGALRFRAAGDSFLTDAGAVPPLIQLPELLAASRRVAEDDAGMPQVKELIDAGSSSLGGARPKASVRDGSRLLLAKFSHPGDEWDVMAWEKTALDLAAAAGIAVPPSELVRIGDQSALLVERFDREGSLDAGPRIGYMSAMSLLQAQDGQSSDYAEMLEALAYFVQDPEAQLEELFRRVCCSAALHNTDDHLRNHGFVRAFDGWKLSPLFDVNPCPYEGRARATTILGDDGSSGALSEARALKELAAYAGLGKPAARVVVGEVLTAMASWRAVAQRNGCTSAEARLFERVLEERHQALAEAFEL